MERLRRDYQCVPLDKLDSSSSGKSTLRSSRAVVAVQSVLILGMIWAYAWPGDALQVSGTGANPPRPARSALPAGFLEVAAVLTVLAASTQGAYMSGIEGQETVQRLTIVLFAVARGFQVWQNFAQVGLWGCRVVLRRRH